MERVRRIELPYSAWEADVLPLNYTRRRCDCSDLERQKPPGGHHQADAEQPIGARSAELALFTLRLVATTVLPNGEAVAGHHRKTHGEDHENQEAVQIENLDEVDVVHGRNGSQQPGGLVHVLDTLMEDPRVRSGGSSS